MAAETDIFQVRDIPPYDGDYELDVETRSFSTWEWRWIKQISGCSPKTIGDAFADGAPDVIVALLVIAMHRAGKVNRDDVLAVADKIADAPFDDAHITFLAQGVEDALPPALTSVPDAASPNGTLESPTSSGDDSRLGSETSDSTRIATGTTR